MTHVVRFDTEGPAGLPLAVLSALCLVGSGCGDPNGGDGRAGTQSDSVVLGPPTQTGVMQDTGVTPANDSTAGNGDQGVATGGAGATGNGGAAAGNGADMYGDRDMGLPVTMSDGDGDRDGDGDGDGGMVPSQPTASPLPAPSDYGAAGPFDDAKMFTNVGPGGNYTLFRPDASLGRDGFKHPIVAWGNGITTTPLNYQPLLTHIASHGFVVIGTNDTTVEEPAMVGGLDWLIEQNDAAGPMQGMLDVEKEATVGYSWGGGAAIDTADRPNVLATVSFHGMPPRGGSAFTDMHAPLLLFTSTGDTFVSRSGYVQPNYDKASVQTALAEHEGYSHITPLVVPGDAGDERAPATAWLYLWVYGEQDARRFFYGDSCDLCSGVWTDFDRKNWPQ